MLQDSNGRDNVSAKFDPNVGTALEVGAVHFMRDSAASSQQSDWCGREDMDVRESNSASGLHLGDARPSSVDIAIGLAQGERLPLIISCPSTNGLVPLTSSAGLLNVTCGLHLGDTLPSHDDLEMRLSPGD